MEGAPVGESQFEILRVCGVEKPKSYEPSRDRGDWGNCSRLTGEVTSGSVDNFEITESFFVVFDPALGVELAVLQDKGEVASRTSAAIQARTISSVPVVTVAAFDF